MKSRWPGLLVTVLVAAGCSAAPAGPITASDTPTPAPTLSVTPSTPSATLPSGTSTASAAPPAGTISWPVPAQREPATVRASGAPPILVVTATGDPSTPPELGQALAAQLESGVLVTRDGAGHTSMMRSDCVREIEERYLIGLETPEPSTICR